MEWKSISRKAPCPCGSAKRYGECCGTLETYFAGQEGTRFAAMRSIAYRGRIGRKRETYCVRYIAAKTRLLQEVGKKLASAEMELGKKVTCEKGCTICCSMYIEATIQECEAIVYFLYHHESPLASFLHAYPAWRAALREQGDIFKGRSRYWQPQPTAEKAASLWREFTEEEDRYFAQGIPCPFLSDGLCSIYEVRPYVCASYGAVTPPEYCRCGSANEPKVVKAIPRGVRSDRSFYYPDQLSARVLSTMQVMVYEVLKSGLTCYSNAGIEGLEYVDKEWLNDPEVSSIYRKYVR
jgi:Fe-S-cluster containining protein